MVILFAVIGIVMAIVVIHPNHTLTDKVTEACLADITVDNKVSKELVDTNALCNCIGGKVTPQAKFVDKFNYAYLDETLDNVVDSKMLANTTKVCFGNLYPAFDIK